MIVLAALLAMQSAAPAGEQPVEPYAVSDANAGAKARSDDRVFQAFHGRDGIDRVVGDMLDRSVKDLRISDVFKAADLVRLKRTLAEQFCYLLGGGCSYTGRNMRDAHKDMGLQNADMNALVEHLQVAMDHERVPFWAQNKLLARLAPMRRDVVER